jgi:hypothetical protein
MKRIGLLFCAFLCVTALFAQTEADFTTRAEGSGVVITRYRGQGGDITIPAAIGGKAVVGIAAYTFPSNSSLTQITIPESVAMIDEWTFNGCSDLTAISVSPANQYYRDIDGVLFSKDNKTLISFPPQKSVSIYAIPQGVTEIGDWAFDGCTGLTQITIPDSVTMIGRGAFVRCTGLTSITLPTGITFISRGVFGRCSGLESITIPENITELGPLAFAGCSSLKSVTLPEDISAAYGAFSECDSLDAAIRADLQERFGDGVFDSYGEGP